MLVFTLVLVGVGMAGAALLTHHAPAVTIALLGAMFAGLCAYLLTDPAGPHWVPSQASLWASVGLAAAGLTGVVMTRGRPEHLRFSARAGWITFALAPVAAVVIVRTMAPSCPYDSHGIGYCFAGDTDLFGGWGTAFAAMFFLDGVVLALLFWISAWQGRPGR